MGRPTVAAAAVAVTVGALTATLTVANATGWVTGAWAEALLIAGIVITLAAVGWIVTATVGAGLLQLATFLFAPAPPSGLVRIVRIMELHEAESNAPGQVLQ